MELFSALIIFSKANMIDKCWFIFELFDLNEHNALTKADIDFMFTCIV